MKKLNLQYEPAFPREYPKLLDTFVENSAKLNIKKDFLLTVLENIPLCLLVFDNKETLVYVNNYSCNLIGYKKEELVNISLNKFFNTFIEPPFDSSWYIRTLKGETVENIIYQFNLKNDSKVKIKLKSYPLKVKNNLIGCLCLLDIV